MACCFGRIQNDWEKEMMPQLLYDIKAGDCYWKTSHNSFMAGFPVGKASRESVITALSNGYRVIELDLNESKHSVTVSHGKWSNSLNLRDVLNDIMSNGFTGTDYPLAIMCDSSVVSEHGRQVVSDEFNNVFGWRLLGNTNMYNFYSTEMEKLRNKLIVCSYEEFQAKGLGEICGLKFGNDDVFNTCLDKLPDHDTKLWNSLVYRSNYQMVRLYPHNVICSSNPDPTKGLQLRAQWIALNDQNRNKHWHTVNNLFTEGPIVKR